MSLQTLLRLPHAISRRLRRLSPDPFAAERQQLAGVARLRCATRSLRPLSAQALQSVLRDAELDQAWQRDQPRIDALALPEMTGGVNPGDQRALYYLVRAWRPRSVLEIGTHIGCSTVNLALACQAVGGSLLTVDIRDVNDPAAQPWRAHGAACSPRQFCERAGCLDHVAFQAADSLDFLRGDSRSFDLIFLDGLHDAAQVYQEIPLALQRLTPGGCIVLHDYFPDLRPHWSDGSVIPGPWLAVQRLRAEGAELAALPLGRLPWPTKLGSWVTSLAVLARASITSMDQANEH